MTDYSQHKISKILEVAKMKITRCYFYTICCCCISNGKDIVFKNLFRNLLWRLEHTLVAQNKWSCGDNKCFVMCVWWLSKLIISKIWIINYKGLHCQLFALKLFSLLQLVCFVFCDVVNLHFYLLTYLLLILWLIIYYNQQSNLAARHWQLHSSTNWLVCLNS